MTRYLDPPQSSGEDFREGSSHESLRQRPELYPGTRAPWHHLYRRGRIWRIALGPGQRASRARVLWDDPDGRPRFTAVTNVLLRWGATELTQRVPLLAVGSNAYPRHLFDKLHRTMIDDTIVAARGILAGLEVAFCPYLSAWGYIPVTPRYRPAAKTLAWLQLVSTSQLEAIAKTERPYELVFVPREVASFTIDGSGECLEGFYVFWHRRWLAMFGELPPVCRGTVAEGDGDAQISMRVRSEEELLAGLAGDLDSELHADSPRQRELLGALLLAGAIEREPPAGVRKAEPYVECRRYGDLISDFADPSNQRGAIVRRTGPVRASIGDRDILAYVPHGSALLRRGRKHAVVYTFFNDPPPWQEELNTRRARLLALPVRVVAEAEAGNEAGESDRVAIDQMARVALGLSPGERCELAALSVPLLHRWQVLAGRLFGARSLAGRAVRASGAVMERPICWMDKCMLSALGIDEGGSVVVGAARAEWQDGRLKFRFRHRRLQALVASAEQTSARTSVLHPEDPDARFPDAAEVLGVFPDLPWVWIDEQTRAVLGMGPLDTVCPVVVRPAAGYLFLRMASRFVLATLGIGAAVAIFANQMVSYVLPTQTWFGLQPGHVVAVGILAALIAVASGVILWNARR